MVEFQLGSARQPLRRILCLGSHCDDIEIGCGGTILHLLRERREVEIYWLVFSSTPVRKKEALRAANLFLASAKKKRIVIRSYRDSFFPSLHARIKVEFEKLKKEFVPDLILTHYRHDLHQDHRVVCELTWNTFRSHLILEYEIPKYDGDLGIPNFFVALDRATCERKSKHILDAFASQRAKQWFTADTFMGLQRIRGIEANSPGGYAEGFHCRKLVW
ncbi:MAG TPA: PIG-L deacetylase family protein [Candidatus Limnocylindria bacterium]|jgi:LmbE family N-acetylglucosaminyl deacetylase|nr:PIG-L deacetylase family protein [Candidatus Limnocylindria bacterium]